MLTDKYYIWVEHLNNCDVCKRAIRGRFCGANYEEMYNKCCEQGKPLYKDFVEEGELLYGDSDDN